MKNDQSPQPPLKGGKSGIHAIYIAIIIVLLVVAVVAGAVGLRAHNTLRDIEQRYSLDSEVRPSIPRAEPLRTLTKKQLLAPRTFAEYRAEVDGIVERALELGEFGGGVLNEACAHALRGGKRLRSIIVLEIARAHDVARLAGGDLAASGGRRPVDAADAALFNEYLHTASLVIDDLPDFDDDDERRGKPAVHIKTTAAIAQMAALSLIAAAFQDVCRQVDWIRDNCPEFANVDRVGMRLCHDISLAIGAGGAAGGQVMDSSLPGDELFKAHGTDAVLQIMSLKTATFFELSFVSGWLSAGGAVGDADELKRAGNLFGTAFQVADDIGDAAQDATRRSKGKPGWNYANEHGEAAARALVTRNLAECKGILAAKGLYTPLWEEIFEKTWGMTAAPEEAAAE